VLKIRCNPHSFAKSEARTVEDRHPERSEAELKDLHSSTPSTTHQETKTNQQPENLGIAPKERSNAHVRDFFERAGFSPAVSTHLKKRL
jgi:hypothetical protein